MTRQLLDKFLSNKLSAPATIITTTCILYSAILNYDFVWDDFDFVQSWQLVKTFPPNLLDTFSGATPIGHSGVYRPVRTILYSLIYLIGGDNPFYYHLYGFVLHVMSGILVYLITKHLFKSSKLGLLGSLLFITLPINIEAFVWITASFDSFAFLLVLASYWLWLKYQYINKSIYITASILCGSLATFTNEIALALPLLLSIHSHFINQYPWKKIVQSEIKYYYIAPAIFAAIRFGILNIEARQPYLFDNPIYTLLIMLPVVIRYLTLIFFPYKLTVNHSITSDYYGFIYHDFYEKNLPPPPSLGDKEILIASTVLLLILYFIFTYRKYLSLYAFGLSWIIISLLPALHLVPHSVLISERFAYLASFGGVVILILNINSFHKFLKRLTNSKISFYATGVLVIFLLSTYSWINWHHQQKWKDELTLWEYEYTNSPKSTVTTTNYANSLQKVNEYQQAHSLYQEAVIIKPDSEKWLTNLATNYAHLENYTMAEEYFIKALEINPQYIDALRNLGYTYYQVEDYQQSENVLQQALEIYPNDLISLNTLAAVYMATGELDKAKSILEMILKASPQDELAKYNLSLIQEHYSTLRN